MREILFRGKLDIEGENRGKWVYGYYYEDADKCIIFEKPYIYKGMGVLKETVGQYTGVDDINGNKIFEGDIVRISAKSDLTKNQIKGIFSPHGETAVVIMEKGRWVVKRQLSSGSYYYLIWLYGDDYDFTVIGNITDNPELLEEEQV